jgi:flagellar hook-basal body complex protein FliE
MTNPTASLTPVKPIEPLLLDSGVSAASRPDDGFGEVFREAVSRVESFRHEADASMNRFLSGQDEELHQVAVATQRAELAFELFLQVKNKVVQAYQEVMRMQL